MDNLIVKAENLVKIYQSGKVRVKALDGVNLIARRGEILSIIGPSGSGKTTLLNIIGGLDKPTKGTVFIDNTEITKLSEEELVKFRLRNIGFVFQYFNLIPSLSVVENVELPLALLGVSRIERRELASTTLRELGLIHRANFNPSELSGGMKQRVNIARALAIEPDVLLMDEPFSNLDPLTAESLRSEVLDIWLSSILPVKSIIMVTHNVEEAVVKLLCFS
ncbi:MAG: ABC transporter ATP-binding protein [Desulfurococcaceae archaeon]